MRKPYTNSTKSQFNKQLGVTVSEMVQNYSSYHCQPPSPSNPQEDSEPFFGQGCGISLSSTPRCRTLRYSLDDCGNEKDFEKCWWANSPPLSLRGIPEVPAGCPSVQPALYLGQERGEGLTSCPKGSVCPWEGKWGEKALQTQGKNVGQNGEGISVFGKS